MPADIESVISEHFGIEHLEMPPRRCEDGSPNPEYHRFVFDLITKAQLAQLFGKGAGADSARKININHAMMAAKEACRLDGFEPKHISDVRSQAEKALDAAEQLKNCPSELLEIADEEIDALLASMDQADREAVKQGRERLEKNGGNLGSLRGQANPKAWCARLMLVKWLRERVRNDKLGRKEHSQYKPFIQAANLLRYMIYVGRSSAVRGDGASAVYRVYPHMVKAAIDIWEAEYKIGYENGRVEYDCIPYSGILLEMPPGHGKTTIVNHWAARRISRHPKETGLFLHAKAEKACDSLRQVADYMDAASASGRRNRALYDKLQVKQNKHGTLRMDVPNPPKSPTAEATGVMSAGLGADHLWQIYDDVVEQSDVEQETDRKRRYDRITGTWMTRLRGDQSFWIYTGYPWHKDDATMKLEKKAREEAERVAKLQSQGRHLASSAVYIFVSKQRCGGPKGVPKFKPLCKELVSQARLRATYHMDASVYASNYMLQPLEDSARIVRKLRLYDPESAEHIRFVGSSINHLSVDPAATSKPTSDKAGIMLIGEGVIHYTDPVSGVEMVEKRARILACHEIHANQSDLVDWCGEFIQAARVDYVHVETRSGYHATAEMFENKFGLDVIRYDPKNMKKSERLRLVAPMLNDANAKLGLRACVEFPGKRDPDGNIIPDYENFGDLYEQILDFGVTADDHLVDCLTQVCNEMSTRMDIGLGAATAQVRAVEQEYGRVESAKRDLFKRLKDKTPKDEGQEEWEFFS